MEMPKRATNEKLQEFANMIQEIQQRIGFKVSARGWCYQLETERYINKDQFDRAEKLINDCRKKGILPLDFTAEEEGRKFSGVEHPNENTPVEEMKEWVEYLLVTDTFGYVPDWWEGEKYYIQMLVEKIDLKTLFMPVCSKYHIPIATCFDSMTEILTQDGWNKFDDVTKNDYVATMDVDGQLIYQNPTRIINERYSGDMIEIKNRGTDQLLTPNHRVYVKRPKKGFKFESINNVVHLKNLQFTKTILWIGEEKDFFYLPQIQPNSSKNTIKDKLDMAIWLQFLGYYLAEGNLNYKPKHNIYRVQLAQKKERHPDIYQKMINCIEKLGYNYYADFQSIQLSNKQLYSYLEPLGKHNEKYIPREFLSLSPRQLKILFDALIEGDGHQRKDTGRCVYITTSKQLADDVQELALKIGYHASLSLKPKSGGYIKNRKIKCEKQCYCVNINRGRNSFRINHDKNDWNVVKYNGTIHCVEVPNGLIYVRRNGKTVWSGNSKGWSSMLQRGIYAKRFKQAEDDGLQPVLLYCGDHDPDGLRISDFIRSNLQDLKDIVWEDGIGGYNPHGLKIVRFGLDADFIEEHHLTWIENLITGSGRDLGSPSHKNYHMPYVQEYIHRFGVKKCEANAIVPYPDLAKGLVENAIQGFLGDDATKRFMAKNQAIKDEIQDFRVKSGLDETLKKAIKMIEDTQND